MAKDGSNNNDTAETKLPSEVTVKFDQPIKLAQSKVSLEKPERKPTPDQALWIAIRNRTKAISFERYSSMIDAILCEGGEMLQKGFDRQLDNLSRTTKKSFEDASKRKEDFQKTLDAIREEVTKSIPKEVPQELRESIINKIVTAASEEVDRAFGIAQKSTSLISGACPTIHGTHAYNVLKLATQIFLMLEAGLVTPSNGKVQLLDPELLDLKEERERYGAEGLTDKQMKEQIITQLTDYFGINSTGPTALPYLKRIMEVLLGQDKENWKERLPYCAAVLKHRFTCPSIIELIWSYWHEQGMLAQTMNAISLRFQNRRSSLRDPLAQMEIDPLRPLNNLLWGFIQDEFNRLTVARRAYEYDHHYGLTLIGKAVPGKLESADSRSKFLETFHNLLYRCTTFYREDADNTITSDGFPLLNALKEAHLVLAEGAHNQFGDLPWTARVEMLLQQWLLARTEMRDFLRGRIMVPYQEPWMGAVDAMNKMQGWTGTSISHFNELAATGEQILLSIRYGDWVNISNTEENAKNWARYWKNEVQRYIHSYQVVAGVDLSADVSDTRNAASRYLQPSELLRRQLPTQTFPGLRAGASTVDKVLIRR